MGYLDQLLKNEGGELLSFPEVGLRILHTFLNKSEREWEKFLFTEREIHNFLIEIANLPRFRKAEEQVTNLRMALLVLGDTTVKILVLGFIAKKLMKSTFNEFSYPKYWSRALAQLIAGFFIADLLENFPKHIPVAAYLMDFGILVMYHLRPEKYLQVLKKRHEGESLLNAERELFGVTHQEIVAEYFENYALSRRFILNLRYHHENPEDSIPKEIQEDLQYLRMIDEACGSFFGYLRELRWDHFRKLAKNYLSESEIEAFGEVFPKMVNSYLEIFGLDEYKLKTIREWQKDKEEELQRLVADREKESKNLRLLLEEYENKLLAISREKRDLLSINERLFQRLQEASIFDELTEVYRESYFLRRVKEELLRARRYNRTFCLMWVEISGFQRIIEKFGLSEGDNLLKEIARALQRLLRRTDIVAKSSYGNHFLVLLTETPSQGSMVVARKILRKIEEVVYEKYKEKVQPLISVISYNPKEVNVKRDPNERSLIKMLERGLEVLRRQSQNRILMLKIEQDIEV
ncbi:MAG: diguanylate cyclase [Caldimicrobium sp.]|nr:diguanylate cyclase [Caldimicrobium sp.]MDW8182799.1 diguanylate cyclase [Caldimicrobium sp.]